MGAMGAFLSILGFEGEVLFQMTEGGVKNITLNRGWGDVIFWSEALFYHPTRWGDFASLIPERAYSGIEIQHFLAYFTF